MRRAPRNSLLAAALLTAMTAQAAPAPNEAVTRQQLQDAERARAAALAAQQAAAARAATAAAQSQRLAARRAAALAHLRAAEAATMVAADRMAKLEARRKLAADQLAQRAAAMRPLLPLIERLSLYPVETLLAVPAKTEDRLRGVLVLQGLAREVARQAAALRRDQAKLADATQAVMSELPKLDAARLAQATAAQTLDAQLRVSEARRQQAESEAEADARRAAAQAAKAATLRAALATLEARRRSDEARARQEAARAERQHRTAEAASARKRAAALAHPTGPGTLAARSKPHGQLFAPVAGKVVRAWGDPTMAGPATGISYQAAPDARVVSLCSGRVDFADRFRSYGLLLIVDCGGGFHSVLAGFARLDVQPGQAVQAGQPVGTMPNWNPGTKQRPALYVELRHGEKAVNPAPWLRPAR